MNVDTFLEAVPKANLRLSLGPAIASPERAPERVDGMFHLPLLALAIMEIARRSPLSTRTLGRSVAILLVEHFIALRRSPHNLETSLTLRRRCAQALAFLEAADLVSVDLESDGGISLTEIGQNHLNHYGRNADDLGILIRQLRVAQERVRARLGNNER